MVAPPRPFSLKTLHSNPAGPEPRTTAVGLQVPVPRKVERFIPVQAASILHLGCPKMGAVPSTVYNPYIVLWLVEDVSQPQSGACVCVCAPLSIHLFIYLSIYLSVYLYICISVYLYIYTYIYIYVFFCFLSLSRSLSLSLTLSLSLSLTHSLSLSLSFSLSLSLSLCMHKFLSAPRIVTGFRFCRCSQVSQSTRKLSCVDLGDEQSSCFRTPNATIPVRGESASLDPKSS